MRIDHIIYSFLIFGFFALVGTYAIGDINTNYHVSITGYSDYDAISAAQNITTNAEDDMVGADAEDITETSLTKKAWNTVHNLPQTFSIFAKIVNGISNQLNLPDYMVAVALGIFALVIFMGLAYFVWGVIFR